MRLTAILPALFVLASAALPAAEDKALEPGAKAFRQACLDCHKGKESIDHLRWPRAKWKDAVERMLDSGFLDPVPSKATITLILDHLDKTQGPDAPAAAAK